MGEAFGRIGRRPRIIALFVGNGRQLLETAGDAGAVFHIDKQPFRLLLVNDDGFCGCDPTEAVLACARKAA